MLWWRLSLLVFACGALIDGLVGELVRLVAFWGKAVVFRWELGRSERCRLRRLGTVQGLRWCVEGGKCCLAFFLKVL